MLRNLSFKFSKQIWKQLPVIPKDPIFYFNEMFNQDKNTAKVNLTIGAYRDEQGKPWNLSSVKSAIEKIKDKLNLQYLNQKGDPDFLRSALQICYGETADLSSISKVQSLSGAGGLMLLFQALKHFYKPLKENDNTIYAPNPTWPLHA